MPSQKQNKDFENKINAYWTCTDFCLVVPYPLDTVVPNANYSHSIYIVLVITRNPEMV